MSWTLDEAVSYFKGQGAPADQNALVNLLREIQQESGGSIPRYTLAVIAESYGIKESFLQAVIKRFPSLRLEDSHCLQLCAGPNCGKHRALAACAEALHAASGGSFTLRYGPCMRLCGKGPNVKWDGVLYHRADEALLKKLVQDASKIAKH